jgi:predicted nuclease of predicted toxin-antitoxin system
MRFLLDMNLPPALADWLRSEGHDAVHACDLGYLQLPDHEIFVRATEDRRVVVSFDLDFGEIAAFARGGGTGVVLLRLRSARHSYLQERLRTAILEVSEAFEAGAIILVEDARIRIRRFPED